MTSLLGDLDLARNLRMSDFSMSLVYFVCSHSYSYRFCVTVHIYFENLGILTITISVDAF